MPRRRKLPSEWRFLVPLVRISGGALVVLFSFAIVDWMVCGVSVDLTHNRAFPCKSVAPGLLWYGAWAVFVLGLVVAGWRAYRDFVDGDHLRDREDKWF